jgi:hypothetical protein
MPITVTITAETPEELARWTRLLAGTAPAALAVAFSMGHGPGNPAGPDPDFEGSGPEFDQAVSGPIRGKAAAFETENIIAAFCAVETLGALDDVKADALDRIDRLPKYRQEEVQAAYDKRHAELVAELPRHDPGAEVPIPAPVAVPGTPSEAPSAPQAMGVADFLATPAPAPALAPPAANDDQITDDQVRIALETCMGQTSFAEAQERMKSLGYTRLSDVPKDRAAREAFIARMREGVAA